MRPVFSVLAVLALGCGNGGKTDNTGTVVLGTGTTEFEPLSTGASLEIIPGPQGGFHFVVHARMSGLDPGDPAMPGLIVNPATTFAAFDSSGQQLDLDFPAYRLGYSDIGDGEFELPSGRILQLRDDRVPALYGEVVQLTVEIRDSADRTATAEVEITAIELIVDPGADAGPDASGQ